MDPGLCATCLHAQPVETARSVFWLCGRAKAEPERFRRYPPLPVLRCLGHERR